MSDIDDDRHSIRTQVAGVSRRQDAVSQCRKGQNVRLVRDPANDHDQNAIEVHASRQIGFIPREESETLALYLDYWGTDDVVATIEEMTGGTGENPTIEVVLDVHLPQVLYDHLVEDPSIIRESISRQKRIAEIDASLTDQDVMEYICGLDDLTLDSRYWLEQQYKWEKEQKEKVESRLGRELESYEEGEIEDKAEVRFLKYRERHEVTALDREKVRNAMTREDVVNSILIDQDLKEIEESTGPRFEEQRKEESKGLVVGMVVVAIAIIIVVALAAG